MNNFRQFLSQASSLPLRFVLEGEQLVPNDFHVTEVKKVSIDAMDCGGNSDSWQEVVVQLWSPEGKHDVAAMTAGKFLDIVQRTGYSALLDSLVLRFEYGDANTPAVQYDFKQVVESEGWLEVTLARPLVACKPRLAGQSCC